MFLITSIKLNITSTELSVKPLIFSVGIFQMKVHPSEPKNSNSSVCKDDGSRNNWPSASATADVSLIPCRHSWSRFLCLIEATNFVAASSEHSFKELMLSLLKADNSGKNWPRASANFDVSLITLSSTTPRGLCLKTSKSLVIAFSAFSVKSVIDSVPNDEL